ncbi:MAG: alpha-amylase family protein, partial [Scrofimicrobium sp.]
MSWVDHAIWWHVYPLGFTGAPIRVDDSGDRQWAQTRLPQLNEWLDYLTDLGCNGLLLGPIFASTSHGYDSIDQFQIDPRLGSERDFAELISSCKEKGVRVLLDGVFSHVGVDHPMLAAALKAGPESVEGRLFDIDWDGPDGPAPRVWEGHGSLVRLDHANAEAQDYAVSVMRYWLERGIDGWRLDAAYSVPPEFWAKVLTRVRQDFPESWFLGEVIHGDYPAFVEDSTVDSVTQYELWKAIWSSLLDDNLFELDWTLKRNNEFLETFTPNIFIGNHDVTRIATTVGAEKSIVAFAILMTVGGIPSVYYGDEQGFTGEKVEDWSGDDAIRPPMPQRPGDLLPYGVGHYRAYQELIALRRRHPWLVNAQTETLTTENT